MDVGTIVSLVAVIVVAIFTSVTAPLILAHRTERMHREDREADYARQDKLAANLIEHNKGVADNQVKTLDQLGTIHTLVNSNMTAEMQARYDATQRELAVMIELMELKRAGGREPTPEVLAAIEATRISLNELGAAIADRSKAQEKINKDSQEGPGGTTLP